MRVLLEKETLLNTVSATDNTFKKNMAYPREYSKVCNDSNVYQHPFVYPTSLTKGFTEIWLIGAGAV